MKVEPKFPSSTNPTSSNENDYTIARLKNPYKAKCVVYGAMFVMLRASRLVCIAPVRLERRRAGWLVSVSPALCLLNFVLIALLNAAAIIGLLSDLSVPAAQSTRAGTQTRRFVWTLDLAVVLVITWVGTYKAPGRINEIILCLGQLQKLKAGLSISSSAKRKEEWQAMAAVIAYALATVTIVVFDYYSYFDEVITTGKNMKAAYLYLSYFIAYIMMFFLEMQFITSAWEIRRTLKYLNDALGEFGFLVEQQRGHMNLPINFIKVLPSKSVGKVVDLMAISGKDKYEGFKSSKTLPETLHHLQATFEGTCDVVRQLSGCFGPEVLVMVVTRFLHLVITPYNFISGGQSVDTRSQFSVAMWCVWHFFCLMALVEPGHFTQKELDRTCRLVCRLLQQRPDELTAVELDNFTKYLLLSRTDYSPMGAFTLSRSLVVAIVGSVLTYLVIIIQFQAAETSSNRGAEAGGDDRDVVDVAPVTSPESATHCVVGGAHAFILRITRVFGLAPLRFEPRANGFTVSISGPMCIYSFILVTILIASTIFGLVAEINVGVDLSVRMSSRMSQVVSTCDVLVVVVTAAAGVYGAPARMRKMLKFMERVASVDTSLSGQYSAVTERKLCSVMLGILSFFSLLIVDDFCFYAMQAKRVDREWEIVVNYVGFYLLWYAVVLLELQFAFTALSVRARFRALNDVLALTARSVAVPVEKVKKSAPMNIFAIRVTPLDVQRSEDVSLLMDIPKRKDTVLVKKNASGEARLIVSTCEAIHGLASLHGTLCEVVHRIDDSYGIPLIVILISTLLHLIVTPYFLIMEIMISSHRIHFLVLQFVWCITHLLRMFVVVEPSHYTIIEGKRTEGLICRLMTSVPSTGSLPSRLELFSRQLLLRSVSYSPMGMCTLNRPLVASILGAVTTYLVILIQLQRYDA